jgi:hypothetical protein
MFGLFKKKPRHTRRDDMIYMSRAIANKAFIRQAALLRQEGKSPVLFYFFESTAEALMQADPSFDLPLHKAERLLNDLGARSALRAQSTPTILFMEHHPSLATEQAVLAAIEELFPDGSATVGFYAGLDDPLMQRFGSEKIIDLMKKMGMKDNEAISHSMVTASIRRAQEKISAKVTAETKCNSAEEWMKINLGA